MIRTWLYFLGYFNIVPMATNLFTPLFQDRTAVGVAIGFLIRINWVIFGSILQAFVTIPLIVVWFIAVMAPVIPFIMIISYVFNL